MDPEKKPRVCISVCEPTLPRLRDVATEASLLSKLIELRLDCLDEAERETESISNLIAGLNCPAIITLRPAEQGGKSTISQELRENFWRSANFSHETLLDLEADLVERFVREGIDFDWSRTICSYHDFDGSTPDLQRIYERLAATPARILKIAVQVHDASDCLRFFKLLERATRENRELIPIAMGTAGLTTRILGPSHGSFLTYAARDDDSSVAPGQISIDELQNIYRLNQIVRQTEIFGVVGYPISHSLSPAIHNAAFAATERNAVYLPFEVRDIDRFLEQLVHPRSREMDWNFRGLSVTAPHKTAVIAGLDWIDPVAQETASVNTIITADNELHGYNTDAAAFIQPLIDEIGELDGVSCAVIGSGSMAQTIMWSLRNSATNATIFARDVTRAKDIADQFGGNYESLNESFSNFDVVINATPLGTFGKLENQTPVTAAQLRGARVVYDLVYNPKETEFLRQGKAAGCATLGGLRMFLAQAAAQFQLFTGGQAPAAVMSEAAEKCFRK